MARGPKEDVLSLFRPVCLFRPFVRKVGILHKYKDIFAQCCPILVNWVMLVFDYFALLILKVQTEPSLALRYAYGFQTTHKV
jgi:hypothetical protein